jgi:hypothetical protein
VVVMVHEYLVSSILYRLPWDGGFLKYHSSILEKPVLPQYTRKMRYTTGIYRVYKKNSYNWYKYS